MRKIVEIVNGVVGNPKKQFKAPINLSILEGEQIAIIGNNGSGKTRLAEVLGYSLQLTGDSIKYDFTGSPLRYISDNVRYISFKDSYGPADNNYFLQQRWEQCFIDEEATPTVRKSLGQNFENSPLRETLSSLFMLEPLMDKFVISLSSGELRKLRLTKAIMKMPRLLVIDNPFIGLDAGIREEVSNLLNRLIEKTGMTLVLVLTKPDMIPDFITHIIEVDDLKVGEKITLEDFKNLPKKDLADLDDGLLDMIVNLPENVPDDFYPISGENSEIVKCNKVSIVYGDRTILKDLDWTVRECEKWLLTGKNGCGKSTLLSLICADNPQSYACDIELFSHKRGSGESIWEIKRNIGYVSPELQRAYQKDISALRIVSSGLCDTMGIFKKPSQEDVLKALYWMKIFSVEDLASRSYLELSDGEQRLCLLARAFVKDPQLLILDEPFHGLDLQHCHVVKQIINAFVKRSHKTLLFVSHFESEIPECINHRLELVKNS